MHHDRTPIRWHSSFCLIVCAAVTAMTAGNSHANDVFRLRQSIYHADPDHLWNRLYSALMIRSGPDGATYGSDRLEPLLWNDSTHLLSGESHSQVMSLLAEFAQVHGEDLIDSPIKRAMLQRDLWMVANWAAGKPADESKQLLSALVRVIRQIALRPDQIAKLPDNYAAAISSKQFPGKYDPQDHERPYLPADLFQPDGPWVCVGRTDGRTAPLHLQSNANNPFTNSTFLIFVKLPGGRDATVAFLKRLTSLKRPMFLNGIDKITGGSLPTQLNPDVPQLPEGAEMALVRKALLIDTTGQIVASPNVESVQLRVIRKAVIPKTMDDLNIPVDERARRMSTFEFQLRRIQLFDDRAGGLQNTSTLRDFKTGFASHSWDEFERSNSDNTTEAFLRRTQPNATQRIGCLSCHKSPSIYSTMSFQRYSSRDEVLASDSPPLYPVAAMSPREVERAAIQWKTEQPAWKRTRQEWR